MNSNKRISLLVDSVKLALVILTARVLISVIVPIVSDDPWTAISSFSPGPFTSLGRVGNITEIASPPMSTALAVIIVFGSGQSLMVAEESFSIGITGAMIVAVACELPGGIRPVAAILFGGFCGALVALVPVFLKMKWNVSELVTSIISNHVVQSFVIHMVSYHFREVSSSNLASLELEKTSKPPVVPDGIRIHAGVVLEIMLCVLVWFLLYRISLGTKLKITGDNLLFAKYTGLKVTGLMVVVQVIAGTIIDIGDGMELLDMYNRFKQTIAPGYGWTGAVAALLAESNPLLVPLAAVFVGCPNAGADIMARSSDMGGEVVGTIQGVMMFLTVVDAPLKGWRQHLIVKVAKAGGKGAMQA